MKETSKIKRDVRDTEPSQNVGGVWIILQTYVGKNNIQEITGNVNIESTSYLIASNYYTFYVY